MSNNEKYNGKKTYECRFTVDEWNVIIAGLIELPYRLSVDIIKNIQDNINTEIKKENDVSTGTVV